MVKLSFKMSDVGTVELHLQQPLGFSQVLEQCSRMAGTKIGGVIAVRNGRVISLSDTIGIHDSIDIFPALSGG